MSKTPYAFLGIPYGPSYEAWELSAAAGAADMVRGATVTHAYFRFLTHWNFDIGEPQFEDGKRTSPTSAISPETSAIRNASLPMRQPCSGHSSRPASCDRDRGNGLSAPDACRSV